ncbi:MAG TPA: type II CAAX endopeptidase family protein [Bacteroidales bacterium]|nr:type II CAAX endopeptidase family protein [Bacteroidales bacterium]
MRQILFPDKSSFMQLGLTVILSLTCFLLVYLLASPVATFFFGANANTPENLADVTNPANLGILRYYQIILSIGLFLIPPFILAFLFSRKTLEYLYLNHSARIDRFVVIGLTMLAAVPFINFMAYWNEHIRLPEFLSGLETYFVKSEQAAKEQTLAFLKFQSTSDLVFNIFMVALLPALAEELMFRGILQRIFTGMTKNAHWGILISSFLFSVIHFQFYGLFPRWILGVMFGYTLLWSGSLWVPIMAHFMNNAIAVMGYYLTSAQNSGKDLTEVGSTPEMLPVAMISLLLILSGMHFLYKRKIERYSITD